jgi:hypothetical protein
MERLSLHFQNFSQLFVPAIRLFHAVREPPLIRFHHLLLLAQVVFLLRQRFVSFVESSFAIADFVAGSGKFLFRFLLLSQISLFDGEFGLLQFTGRFALGPPRNFARRIFHIDFTQPIQKLHDDKRYDRGHNNGHEQKNELIDLQESVAL